MDITISSGQSGMGESNHMNSITIASMDNRLHDRFGITGNALKWIKSYISERNFKVQISSKISKTYAEHGVPQGSGFFSMLYGTPY